MDSAIGRDAAVDEAWRRLTERRAVALEGPAGIGKTVVLRALAERARQAGWLVLSCAPTESESALPFAALADLLSPLAQAVPSLPAPQRVAAQVVLLASEVDDNVVDERAVGAATRSLLEAAAASVATPVLVAIDDVPWLDGSSERALRFALRRLGPRVAVLTARRLESSDVDSQPLGLESLAPIGLSPLGVGPMHHILRAHLGTTLARPLLARIVTEAGGNPLLTLTLARAVLRLPRPPGPDEDLPVTSSIASALTEALATLPDECRDAVRLAALLGVPTMSHLSAAGVVRTAFEPAEDAGLLTLSSSTVDFAHPMYASAVRAGIPAGVRRRLHRMLADAVDDQDERARQLIRCTVEPDETVATEVTRSAQRQHARGAVTAAADLYELAAELTPLSDRDDRLDRLLAAARCRNDSGDHAAAAAAADAIAAQANGEASAEALLQRAIAAWGVDDFAGAISAAERGLAAVAPRSRAAARLHAHLSLFHDAAESGREHAQLAADLLDPGEDRDLACAALLHLFFHEVRAGRPPRTALIDRALELEGDRPTWLAATIPAIWWKAVDDHVGARQRLRQLLDVARDRGDEPWQIEILTHLGESELQASRFDAAEEHIAAARTIAEQVDSTLVAENWLGGMLDAHRGRLEDAAAVVTAGLAWADEFDSPWGRRTHLHLAGFIALSAGRMADAAAAYGDVARVLSDVKVVEPLSMRFEPDWIEACVGAGDLPTAGRVLARLAERHARIPRPWTTLGLARSRLLVASAAGEDVDAALADLAAALDTVPATVIPLDRARCLLVAGIAHRRARRKAEARSALEAARTSFEALGANAFAERARSELSRLGARSPDEQALTPTELRVARLAAQGETNRAIADALFISPKTVEANLARVYRKLGVANRAQLATAMANQAV